MSLTTRRNVNEELCQRVKGNHRFTIRRNSSVLTWFTLQYYLWLMYHITQNELNIMGFGPRPMEFATFVEDAHFRELFARAGTVIENQHDES